MVHALYRDRRTPAIPRGSTLTLLARQAERRAPLVLERVGERHVVDLAQRLERDLRVAHDDRVVAGDLGGDRLRLAVEVVVLDDERDRAALLAGTRA